MVKVILTEIRHFECPNEKVEENGLVTKSSILSKESLGWPNTQIHIYTNTVFAKKCWYFTRKRSQSCWGFDPYGGPSKKIVPPSQGDPGANTDQRDSLGLARNTPKKFFFSERKRPKKGEKSGAGPLSWKSNLKSSTKREIWHQRI